MITACYNHNSHQNFFKKKKNEILSVSCWPTIHRGNVRLGLCPLNVSKNDTNKNPRKRKRLQSRNVNLVIKHKFSPYCSSEPWNAGCSVLRHSVVHLDITTLSVARDRVGPSTSVVLSVQLSTACNVLRVWQSYQPTAN